MKRHKMAVIGLGNRLLADEGAGLHAVELLREFLPDDTAAVDLVEGGTPGMALLHQFDEREKIIFIDSGNCGLIPGDFRRFVPEEAISKKEIAGHSLHEFDLMEFLDFAKRMNMATHVEVVIYCMQAAEMVMSENLSPVVQQNLPRLVHAVMAEVKQSLAAKGYRNERSYNA